jgi:hypothetical protein
MLKTTNINKYPIILPKQKKEIPTPEHQYRLHGIFVVVGRRASGKSVATASLLRHMKKEGVCDRVFLISPTAVSNKELWDGIVDEEDMYEDMNNTSVEKMIEQVEIEKEEWENYLLQLEMWKQYKKLLNSKKSVDDEALEDFLLKCYDLGIFHLDIHKPPESKYGHKPVLHLVCDDIQSSPLFNPSTKNKFLNMAIRHRHLAEGLGVTLHILIQNYSTNSGLPKAIRENCTTLMVFPVKDENMVKTIQSECAGEIAEETFYKMFNYATNEPHSFLSIEFAPKKKEYMFRKGFNTFLTFEKDGDIQEKKVSPQVAE